MTVPAAATQQQALSLLSAEAVRTRASRMLDIGLRGGLGHFAIDLDRLDTVADAVLAVSYTHLTLPTTPYV